MEAVINNDLFGRLVGLAQAAGLDQRKWDWFLKELSVASGGARVQLFSHDIRNRQPLGFHEYGHDPDFLASYQSHYGSINPWIGGFPRLRPGEAVLGRQIVPDEDLVRTEFYNDWIRPQDDIIGSAAAILRIKSNRVTAIAANTRRVDRERVEPRIRFLLQLLVPHLRKSLEISDTLGNLTLENRVLRAGMEPELSALFVLDARGRLCHANARGEAMLESGTVVQLDRSFRLVFTDSAGNSKLARARHDRNLCDLKVSLPFIAGHGCKTRLICQTTPLSEADGPHPWVGPAHDSGQPLTMLILSPFASRLDPAVQPTSLG